MKTIAAVFATAAISAAGAHAYDAAVTPSQFAALQARVTKLERFRTCMVTHSVDLTQNSNGVMVWGIGPPTPHAARFFAIPNTSPPPIDC